MPRSLCLVVTVQWLACAGLALESTAAHAGPPPSKPAFEVTEAQDQPRCSDYTPQRRALFGATHLHTGLSFDASIRFIDYASGNSPRGAYRFAKRLAPIVLPEPSGRQGGKPLAGGPSRTPMIDRAIDWGAVTDHAEHFGLMGLCKGFLDKKGQEIPEEFSLECRMINHWFYEPKDSINPKEGVTLSGSAFTQLTYASLGAVSRNTRVPLCEYDSKRCDEAELSVWGEIQRAANEEYDRCKFTTFIAYENTSSPLGNNWHRNVIFRNDRVVTRPVTAIDMAVEPNPDPLQTPVSAIGGVVKDAKRAWPVPAGTPSHHPLPQPFWNKLEEDCLKGQSLTSGSGTRCDFITIPHNTNLGGGSALFPPLFLDPYNSDDAKRHQQMEPLVEIYQDKGSSECRYDPRFLAGTDTIDEQCAFELLDSKLLNSVAGATGAEGGGPSAPSTWGSRSYVRNIWKDGIQYAAKGTFGGVNPFKMGVVAATDSHTGVMGWTPENEQWPGHSGIKDVWPMSSASSIQESSGGHSVVWAEENSRDSIFEALKRKETYGTSGTRIVVRFFGGWDFPTDACERDFVQLGYSGGVPMGGDLRRPPSGKQGPTFITAAWADDVLKTNLQQIQIIKGWVTADGREHERVFTVAGQDESALNQQSLIDPVTCKPKPDRGASRLCGVWRDPTFNPNEHAFYYVRVLEEPVCRYSTLWCRKWIGVDPLDTSRCQKSLDALKTGTPEQRLKADHGAMCCSNQLTDTFVQPVIQERAWTSPIWYEPKK
ncbi:DUF3604 domain-containing protein [Hyalangium gracile]|uniref:DUF3604 domain-containing protein n=1 Tax=Hyalangium gracile TaxID=394092 RepID=UPI001CCC2D79|nr:DUF3604 domain-containing protein [Hyalangium gracile]